MTQIAAGQCGSAFDSTTYEWTADVIRLDLRWNCNDNGEIFFNTS